MIQRGFSPVFVAALAAAAGVASAACGVSNPEVKSGADATRAGATPVELGKEVTDSVSFNDGDRTDWWELDFPGPGKAVLDVLFGNTSARCGLRVQTPDGK